MILVELLVSEEMKKIININININSTLEEFTPPCMVNPALDFENTSTLQIDNLSENYQNNANSIKFDQNYYGRGIYRFHAIH